MYPVIVLIKHLSLHLCSTLVFINKLMHVTELVHASSLALKLLYCRVLMKTFNALCNVIKIFYIEYYISHVDMTIYEPL